MCFPGDGRLAFKGIASGKRVEAHIIVKRYSLPDLVFGNGPPKRNQL